MLFSPALATCGDKLTAFGSESITYDEYGRTSRYRGKNIFYGGYDAHNISYFGNVSFTYYEDGMRRTKAVGNVTHYYTYDGINLIREEWGNNTIVFLYDAGGLPIGMQYRNSSYASGVWDTYYYEKNLQGDIIAVYNSSGTKLVTYTYDAWGYIISTTYSNGGASTAAAYNPLKYRGYYYDDDLDLYYLATRYYDPEVCRFITADDPGYLGANGDIISYNLYAYCNNNPVMYSDPSGHLAFWAISLIVVGILTVATGIGEIVAYNNAEEVYEQYKDTIQIEDNRIKDSYKVKNPLHIWALSAYVRYYTDSESEGSSYGLAIEWTYHNLGNLIGIDGGKDVDFGKTILSDFEDHNEFPKIAFPIIMNLTELATNPVFYLYDVVRYFQ